jgi:DNA-binding NarL/FixJ family response regulator
LRLLVRRSPGQPEEQLGKFLPGGLFQVDVADCADELELMLRGTEPDVVLIDLSTPTLDNRKSFDIARELPEPPPVIVFGPRENISLLSTFIKHGAHAMFVTDDDPDIVTHSIRQAADLTRLRRENQRLRLSLEQKNRTVGILEHLGEAMSTVFDVRRILNCGAVTGATARISCAQRPRHAMTREKPSGSTPAPMWHPLFPAWKRARTVGR